MMLRTEMRNPKTTHIDRMRTIDMLQIINEENAAAVKAVEMETPHIAQAVDAISDSLQKGGRLFYIGAGTSGRLGVVDASECPPTYGVSPDLVTGIIAGGRESLYRAAEGAEDRAENGAQDVLAYGIQAGDVLVGISAAGGAPYVLGAMREAAGKGCLTIALTANPGTPMEQIADLCICTDTGPEVITGSTRMKAGTAQKLVLNMLSTCAMIKLGKVYENLMINLSPTNNKLKQRMIRIVTELLACDPAAAEDKLTQYDWNIRALMDAEKGEAAAD